MSEGVVCVKPYCGHGERQHTVAVNGDAICWRCDDDGHHFEGGPQTQYDEARLQDIERKIRESIGIVGYMDVATFDVPWMVARMRALSKPDGGSQV